MKQEIIEKVNKLSNEACRNQDEREIFAWELADEINFLMEQIEELGINFYITESTCIICSSAKNKSAYYKNKEKKK